MMSSYSSNTTATKKHSTLRLLLLVSSFLASATAFQAGASPQPTTSLGYTVTSDVPESAYQHNVNVQNLMSNNKAQHNHNSPQLPNMVTVSTQAEFHQEVSDSPQSPLTVVRFHAPFCKACQAMAPALNKFAKDHPDIKFVQVAYDKRDEEIRALTKSLSIQKVPFGLVYSEGNLVEKANLNKRYFGGVQQMIESYQQGLCELPQDVDEYSSVYEAPYAIVQ